MTIEQLRRAWDKEPFEPFELRLADGRVLRVPRRDFMLVPPTAQRTLGIADDEGVIETVDLLLVVSIKPINGKSKRRRAAWESATSPTYPWPCSSAARSR